MQYRKQRIKRIMKGLKKCSELQEEAGSMAVHTDIHELRCNGYKITRHYIGRVNNRSVYGYKLEE